MVENDRFKRLLKVTLFEPQPDRERPGLTFLLGALVIAATLFGLVLGIVRAADAQTLRRQPPAQAYLIVCPNCPTSGETAVIEWSLSRDSCHGAAEAMRGDGVWARCEPGDEALDISNRRRAIRDCEMRRANEGTPMRECLESFGQPSGEGHD